MTTTLSSKTFYRNLSHFGRFCVSGKDAAALLHHLTTNDIKKLESGAGCDAVLLTSKARILDWLEIWRDGEQYLVLTSPNRRAIFAPHAQKFILYRQEVKIEDISETGACFGLFGGELPKVLAGWESGSVLDSPMHSLQKTEIDGTAVTFSRTRRLPGTGVLLWSDDAAKLQELVENSSAQLCDDALYNRLRVEAGIPVTGLELTEAVNPWEANFDSAISLDKGCYNGQEVVARLHSYKKIKQRLMGLQLENALPLGESIALKSEGRAAGMLTSSAVSPELGAIGLGYIRTNYQKEGQVLELESTPAQKVTVQALPFEL